MADCCNTKEQGSEVSDSEICPSCKSKGRKVKIITLKSMLIPTILDTLNASLTHYFCSTKDCKVVYYDTSKKTYITSEVKVSVYQKDNSSTVPVCYCFGWTKEKIKQYVEDGLASNPVEHIRDNINENRCGCEVNNPQGSCCLRNVTSYTKSLSLL
ncbi:putative iron-sulfur cluster-binding metallochaperone [Heyndrickxia sporothermodurans]|uniref:putative iron-sulfur cluster-binding metallochaperone n=1 Tax=Heyndrickxia sporothermodurans TaxID=46224 RepID=UPI002E215907|nr:(2Fe-2S)-binding protein [Heyndrickxia sporothermodurans]MED3700151.1 (2Fe-2S)-binding protein [Heyndrickxia sporothermodurans]MED3779715.1 (2Fe-2S)-binding protein [Heyndrickxia sporothermodurans]